MLNSSILLIIGWSCGTLSTKMCIMDWMISIANTWRSCRLNLAAWTVSIPFPTGSKWKWHLTNGAKKNRNSYWTKTNASRYSWTDWRIWSSAILYLRTNSKSSPVFWNRYNIQWIVWFPEGKSTCICNLFRCKIYTSPCFWSLQDLIAGVLHSLNRIRKRIRSSCLKFYGLFQNIKGKYQQILQKSFQKVAVSTNYLFVIE